MKLSKTLIPCLLFSWATQVLASADIQHWQTENGSRVYFLPTSALPIVDIRIVFDAGSTRDSDKGGLATLVNGLLAEGAGGMSADEIAERFADSGTRFSNSASKESSVLSLRSLRDKKYLEPALETLIQVMSHPDFPEAAIERVRRQILAVIEYRKQSPGNLASEAFSKALYGEHPYAAPSEGTAESVSTLTKADIQAFYQKYYVARNAVIAIVGDLDKPTAESLAKRLTSTLPVGEAPPALPAPAPLVTANTISLEHPSDQTHVLLGQLGMSRKDPDYFALYVGNHILGGGGLVSLLADEVREKRGLSYSVYSRFSPMQLAGPFVMGLQTRNDQAEDAINVTRDTLVNFIEKGPTEKQLKEARQYLQGSFALRIDSNSELVSYLATIGFYGLPLDYLTSWTAKATTVSAAQIQDAFKRRINPDKLLLVTAGGK